MPRGGARPGAGRKKKAAAAPSAPPPVPAPPAVEKPIGAPPVHLDEKARAAWRELAQRARPGLLTWRHRPWLEGTAALFARLRDNDWDGTAGELARMQAALQRLGLVP